MSSHPTGMFTILVLDIVIITLMMYLPYSGIMRWGEILVNSLSAKDWWGNI